MPEDSQEFRASRILLGTRSSSAINRVVARFVDGLIVAILYFLGSAYWAPLGLFLGAMYCSFQDSMGTGQSFGKRMLGLRVLHDSTQLSCDTTSSFLRNLPFTLFFISVAVPWFLVVAVIIFAPLLGLETYLLLSLNSGNRLGDILGNTRVIDYLDTETTPAQSDAKQLY